jgi:trimethylamine--corrinoid protein Co-methyltransferase
MSRYETAFYQPMLSDWKNYESWVVAGSKDALECAGGIWQQALQENQEPPMDPAIREKLAAYVARRREAIGDGEP